MNIWITGPESCGKTELAQFLVQQLDGAKYVEEYARLYLEKKLPSQEYSHEELRHIVEEQISRWEIALSSEATHRVFDGDVLVLKIWVEEVYGETWPSIERWLNNFSPNIILLCKPDVPWIADPLRSNPHDRDRLFDKYVSLCEDHALPYHIISGEYDKREKAAIELVSRALSVDDSK
ncbi:MAG: AAA family ATPase [Flavobacteriales bacterium]|jgi:nicotinamide riboside kinase